MKKIFNKKIALLLLTILIILSCTIYLAINKKGNVFNSIVNKENKLANVEDDNWELSMVFYDKDVDNGQTPLTEIDWHADDRNATKNLVVQINYKNTNVQNDYNPNEVRIEMEWIAGRNKNGNHYYYIYGLPPNNITAGSLSDGYDWNGKSKEGFVKFYNNSTIEKNTNIEGSLQVEYPISPTTDIGYPKETGYQYSDYYVSSFAYNETQKIKATLYYGDKAVTSNEISLTFTSEKEEYEAEMTPYKITYLDGLENANDYVWVKWYLGAGAKHLKPRLAHEGYIKYYLPEGSVVYDPDMNKIEVEGNYFTINDYSDYWLNIERYVKTKAYIIGYPKAQYENQEITNRMEVFGIYDDETEYEKLAEASETINLANYVFKYPGQLYSIRSDLAVIYSAMVKAGRESYTSEVDISSFYTGTKYDAIVYDDITIIQGADGTYRILNDSEYYIKDFYYYYLSNGNGVKITGNDLEIYVRYANTNDFVKYPGEYKVQSETHRITFEENNIVGVKLIIKDLEESIDSSSIFVDYHLNTEDIINEGYGYDIAGLQIRQGDEIVNTPTSSSYPSYTKINIAEYDIEHYGKYIQRSAGTLYIYPNQAYFSSGLTLYNTTDVPAEEKFIIDGNYTMEWSFEKSYTNDFYGAESIELLPEGLEVYSSEEEIRANMKSFAIRNNNNKKFKTSSGLVFNSYEEFWDYNMDHVTIDIIPNYKGTNRTLFKIRQDFTDDPLIVSLAEEEYNYPKIRMGLKFYVTYENYLEYGGSYSGYTYGFPLNQAEADYTFREWFAHEKLLNDTEDLNDNGITNEKYVLEGLGISFTSLIESHQDVQTTVQTDQSNFTIGEAKASKNSEYTYKLRVRSGQNDVTNLVIYDSLEDYAKNPDLEIIKASGGKPAWHGELLSIDTSHAEEQGYTVKVYYNENSNPGTLADDTTWQEYTDSTDKTLVKALAFKYLDSEGDPAVLPANTNTYVLIKMKSPDEDLTYFTYNGCWTEWNAIDSVTGRPVDFITGINSNIVKVALPTSVESFDRDITFEKEWKDNNNSLGLRPTSVKYNLIPNGHTDEAIEVELTGTGNIWQTTMSVPALDDYGIPIIYTIEEQSIPPGNDYRYVSEKTDTFKYTNTLYKSFMISKIWKDNRDAYNTRPSSIDIKVMQNGNYYKTVSWGASLSVDSWGIKDIGPVFDDNGNEYTYTIEEDAIDGYSSSCSGLTCINTITGNEEFTIKKVWQDNDNEYDTRPSSVDIRLKRNGEVIGTYTLSGTSNTWETPNIITNKYDANGVKYVYTIDETPLDEYGLVTYDQANHKVTNTLKKNISITVTKNWVDGSNEQGLRPDSLTINLLRNNSQYQELTLTGTGDTWSTTIEVPKYDDNQQEYTYSIRELTDNLNEDYSNITYSEQELSVTNKLEKKVSIKVKKIWDDNDNELLTRPESLNINLLRNGTLYQELTLTPESVSDNTWELNIDDLDAYDNNGAKYTYTIEENLIDQLSRYETITYDQTNYTITNKLTVPPKVTLFFTVKNGYVPTGGEEIQYDEEGYNNVLGQYNLNGEDEYTFNFELENVDTGEIIKGKLSTQGVLEFDDIPYGTYRAREGEDKYFDFVSMVEIELVLGVSFTPDDRGGTITITPTGQDIVYGAHITNKIAPPIYNPETYTGHKNIILYLVLLTIGIITGLYFYRRYRFVK